MSLRSDHIPKIGESYWIIYNYDSVGFYKVESKIEGIENVYKCSREYHMEQLVTLEEFYPTKRDALEKALDRATDTVSFLENELNDCLFPNRSKYTKGES